MGAPSGWRDQKPAMPRAGPETGLEGIPRAWRLPHLPPPRINAPYRFLGASAPEPQEAVHLTTAGISLVCCRWAGRQQPFGGEADIEPTSNVCLFAVTNGGK